MNKIKYVCLLIILSIFISGCNVDYNLDMSKETISENITINFTLKECNEGQGNCEEYARNLLNTVVDTEGYPNYNLEYYDDGENGTVKLSYTYASLNDFIKNNSFKSSYNNIQIDKDTFSVTEGDSSYESPLETKYKVTIIPNKKVKRSNADSKNGNKYIWEFKSSDMNKDIKFSYKTAGTIDKNNKIVKSELNTLYFILIIIVIGVIVGISIVYYSAKNKTVNKL